MVSADVVIVGGGIVGCACAYYLACEGVSVVLLERGPLGSGASRAGMSHVVTWEEPEVHLDLARASQKLYETLGEALGMDIEYRRTGSIAVVESPEGLPAMQAMLERLRVWGLDCQFLDNADLRRMEPNLAPDLAGGAYFPGDGMVNPLATTQALARAARAHGAEIRTHAEVTTIERDSRGHVAAVRTGTERIACEAVVIAAGAWSASAATLAGVSIEVRPRKGVLVVTSPVPNDLLRCKVILSAGYMDSIKADDSGPAGGGVKAPFAVAANIQQVRNGNLLLGSTRQYVGFDLQVEPEVMSAMLARCLRFLPALRAIPAIRSWAGLRPATVDLLPVIGMVSQVPGLYIATGHEGIGITEAPITGLLISQLYLQKPTSVSVDQLSPDRFQKQVMAHERG